jgi:hypothetical protein
MWMTAPMPDVYTHRTEDIEEAQNTLRIQRIIFFGTVLCGCTPPVLKCVKDNSDVAEYISIVQNRTDAVGASLCRLIDPKIIILSISVERLGDTN